MDADSPAMWATPEWVGTQPTEAIRPLHLGGRHGMLEA